MVVAHPQCEVYPSPAGLSRQYMQTGISQWLVHLRIKLEKMAGLAYTGRVNTTNPPTLTGLRLCERFYWEAVRPLLDDHFPDLRHGAALIGPGSEVLGFDDTVSTDHHWGPRVLLFLHDADHRRSAQAVRFMLAHSLPHVFAGYPTNFSAPDPNDNGVQLLTPIEDGPVNHRVELHTLAGFVGETLGFDLGQPLEAADWLTFPQQKLRSLTAGAVYHDEVGLQAVRSRFAFYPHDLWLYLLAAGWARIGQEEHLMGRAGSVGDEVGAALIGARLTRDVMRLCFLMERVYAPYAKWFGTAFNQLACGPTLQFTLQNILSAPSWQERERWLVVAYEAIAVMHNALQLTPPLPTQVREFFGRPFRVMALHGFAQTLIEQIHDPAVQRIAARPPIGGIDQWSDNTDLLENTPWRMTLRRLYEDDVRR